MILLYRALIYRYLIVFFALLPGVGSLMAQDSHSAYSFLRFPASARISALGGHNISLIEADPALAFHNPALLGGEMDGKVSLSFMNWFADVRTGSAIFAKNIGERGALGIGATYINYGTMQETSVDNQALGTFSAQDLAIYAMYEYDLSEMWRGALSLKYLYSTLADYTSYGLAVDAGLSYFDSERDLGIGITLKNVGAQLKPFYEERQKVPWDLQAGFTKRMAHAPVRLSVTAMYLNRWKFAYTDATTEKEDSFGATALKHLVFGLEFLPSDNFWVGIGYNPKTGKDMQLETGNGLGGFSAGAGVKVSRISIGASVARYHPSATSLMVSLALSFNSPNL